jgi:hypothetical protein
LLKFTENRDFIHILLEGIKLISCKISYMIMPRQRFSYETKSLHVRIVIKTIRIVIKSLSFSAFFML